MPDAPERDLNPALYRDRATTDPRTHSVAALSPQEELT